MRATDVSVSMSTVTEQTRAREAARILAAQDLPGLVAVVDKARVMTGVITLDGLLDRMLGT